MTQPRRQLTTDEVIQEMANQIQELKDKQDETEQRNRGATTKSTIKPSKPLPFSGRRNESIENWIRQVERFFVLAGIHADDQVEWAAYYLNESAASWFEVEKQHVKSTGDDLDWDTLSKKLKKRFKPINADENARERLS
jgi:hypothetical protein